MNAGDDRRIAVIGLGPRGVGALEALAALAETRGLRLSVDVFDPFPAPGAGPNFDPDESPLCRLNIPMRDIDLRAPDSLNVRPLADWLDPPIGPDDFPPRARLGAYIQHRLDALDRSQGVALSRIAEHVDAVRREGDGWLVQTGDHAHGPYAEVLLVPGQPKTKPDPQLADWQAHASRTGCALAQVYPAKDLLRKAEDWAGRTVAVRGFALSSFDVLRVLTQGLGGRFTSTGYQPSGNEPRRIVPFSLDGQPPFPKPETEEIDARFDPLPDETTVFEQAIATAACGTPETARQRISDSLVPPVHRILAASSAKTGADAVAEWLDTEWSDPGSQDSQSALDTLNDGIAMAAGSKPPSIGYAVGQVWRKWQDQLRQGYNPADTAPDTAALIVGFDEGLKRYSYGPPVDACRELHALIEAGIVTTRLSCDPGIALVDAGWRLTANGEDVTADVMIDAVLPSPDPAQLVDGPVPGLMEAGWLTAPEDLAARTAADGRLVDRDGRPVPGLCLLGRLALGSVIAADSLHDCFGMASHRWAEGVLSRIA
ncbi:FAD/NAD(P)-binding protein [Psychromarinibacter halotolerans]|uniref:FAD/NAD(P)-binding protein n=1 Tax=Psychromarinibacter halotolerans TaxID=1775175 RepID=A0ABV7GNL8_9RHOB|nr:FAD/NAD(P)-binding domain-containing protein [Psychromarinibacter halotolerans]MDF0595679.1 FAD/NAD(P)-binding protein [Psychromarinibacter halotolerans]